MLWWINPTIFCKYPDNNHILFLLAFSTSVFSSVLGLTKYLKLGPCRILPRKRFCGGFPLVMLSMGSTLVGKVLSFALCYCLSLRSGLLSIGIWILFNILPQVIYVSTYLLNHTIFKKITGVRENFFSGTFYFCSGNWY